MGYTICFAAVDHGGVNLRWLESLSLGTYIIMSKWFETLSLSTYITTFYLSYKEQVW